MSYGSPFTPKPGDVPLWPHGRAAEFDAIRDLAQRVAAGEVGDTNGLLIHGTQGIGKTALLNAASKQLADGGWQVAVISKYDSHDLSDIFRNSVDAQRMRGFAARARERSARLKGSVHGGSLSIGLLRGLGASVDIGPSKASTDIAQQLVDAGQRAARSARPAMILIDDLDNWSPSELRQLCNGLEQCSQAGSPVGVIATSAPAGDLRLARADRAGVFDARRLGRLTPSEAQAVLLHTAGARGIAIEPGACDRLLTFSQGHPQRLQLAAHEACKAMAPNSALLTGTAADHGIERAIAKLDRQVYAPKWHMLTPAEQSVAQALASVGGNLPRDRAVLRAHLPWADRAQFEPACDALVRKDVVFEDAGGRLAFSNPGTAAWIMQHRAPIGSPIHVLRGSPHQRPLSVRDAWHCIPSQATRPRCKRGAAQSTRDWRGMTQPASAERQRMVPGLDLDIDDVIDTPAQVAAVADAASDNEIAAIIRCTEALAAYVAELHAPHGFDQFLTPVECAKVAQFIAGLGENAARADEFFEPRTGLELRHRNAAAGWNAATAREASVRGTERQTQPGLPAYALECIALLQALVAYLDDLHGTDGFQEVLTPQERSKVGELISRILAD